MSDFPNAVLVVNEAEVQLAYRRLAAKLQPQVEAGDCVLLAVLMGGLIPAARIAALLTGDFVLDACRVSRYRGELKGGTLQWLLQPHADLEDKTVLVVDDIYDEGITLEYVMASCLERGAARVLSAVLVSKRHQRADGRKRPDFIGVEVDDRYVFGGGMDLRHRWRHLPSIYALNEEVER